MREDVHGQICSLLGPVAARGRRRRSTKAATGWRDEADFDRNDRRNHQSNKYVNIQNSASIPKWAGLLSKSA
jgi:antitoxin (DNA-binding transcriptional repressor) of toxin-antitoxin stability system